MVAYYWITFALSFFCLLKLPTKMNTFDNIIGSFLCAMLGFMMWPLYVVALFKAKRRGAA